MGFLLVFLLIAECTRTLGSGRLREVAPALLAISILYLGYASLAALLDIDALRFWPDSWKYYEHAVNLDSHLIALVRDGDVGAFLRDSQIFSRNFFYHIFLGTTLIDHPGIDGVIILVLNGAIYLGLFLGSLVLTERLCQAEVSVAGFTLLFVLGSSGLFWSLFLLKDTLVALLVVSLTLAAQTRRVAALGIGFVLLLITRWYLVAVLVPVIILWLMFRAVHRPSGITAALLGLLCAGTCLAAYEFTPLGSIADHFFAQQHQWRLASERPWLAEAEGPMVFGLYLLKYLLSPIVPEGRVAMSLYAYPFWKTGLAVLIMAFGLPAFRRRALSADGVLLLLVAGGIACVYGLFPRFANFRHRSCIEPLLIPLFYLAAVQLQHYVRRIPHGLRA